MSAEIPSFRAALRVWLRIGLLSFGGPAGQIALMHKELVERRRWIDEPRFLHALNYCMLLPGPEAQQLAIYIGWLLHRVPGGIVAGGLFVLPGFLAVLALSMAYASLRSLPLVSALFFGLKAAVLALVLEALLRIGKRALRSRLLRALAVLAFLLLFFLEVPFPAVVLAAGLFGALFARLLPAPPNRQDPERDAPSAIDRLAAEGRLQHTTPRARRALFTIAIAGGLWAAPVLVMLAIFGPASVWVDEGRFFSKAAVVTFGGAYAVLAYIAQQAVAHYHWLLPGEMLDGLGLAETTPGPLILVVEFVGFLGAYGSPGPLPPLLAGVLGAAVTVWVTFVPCFLWVFLGGPYIERLRGERRLNAALSAITAAVVGVIANLSVWFALHVLFGTIQEERWGPLRILWPAFGSLDPAAATLAIISALALFRFHLGVPQALGLAAALGAAWRLLA
ncbi:MAG: chromate efflux transporter [Myxococcota bacterium]